MRIRDQWKGSYTVEASLLMGMIIPVLVSIIYIGFFLHDRSFTQAAAYEAAVYGCLHTDDKDADVQSAARKLTEGRLLGTAGIESSGTLDKKSVQIHYDGVFRVPGMIMPFFAQKQPEVSSSVTLTTERPSARIQKIRGLTKIVNTVRGKEP